MSSKVLLSGLLLAVGVVAAERPQSSPAPAAKVTPGSPETTAQGGRPVRIDSAAQRNENVVVWQIDTNAIKEANIRLGANVTLVSEPPVESSVYATEHGRPAGESVLLRPAAAPAPWHAELFGMHQNSVFNARTFFQVGPVKPSRRNNFGGRFTGALGSMGYLTADAAQNKIRGMVNGNVLVPLASERTPRAADPAVRAIVSRWLAAYPLDLPNRLDFDQRALNTNAPQRIDDTSGTLRLDRAAGSNGRLSISHALTRQRIDAFQFVAGQNPDTEIHSHRSRLTWRRSFSPATDVAVGFAFNRTKSVLLPEPNAVGPRVRFGYSIEELGPDSQFPINRAQNSFRWGAALSRQSPGSRHALVFGGDVTRSRLNGIETNNARGQFQFGSNFGRNAIENLLHGTATTYEVAIGELSRGFRNWSANAFAADRWKAGARLQIYYGIRFNLETTPSEAHDLNRLPYPCDCNNFSPRLAVAYQLGAGWVMRTSYTVSFGGIPQVSYQQIRYNLPLVRYIQVQNPDLADPLRGIRLDDVNGRSSPTVISPDLVSPYAHQYNFSLEKKLANRYQLRLGYVGSRSFKLMDSYVMNRAEPVPGIPLTTATVNERRPDPRYFEVKQIVNGGIAYLDAAQIVFEAPLRRGLAWSASYTFGKAIDAGSDYSGTAANKEILSRSQWQYDSHGDKKGLSTFDSTHAVSLFWSYDLPRPAGSNKWANRLAGGWQISGAGILKSGTPLTLYMGSDAPGFGNVDGGPSDRPHILDPSILGKTISHPDTAQQIIRRDRFGYMTPGERRGSLGRNTFRKAGIANVNAAVTRQFRGGGPREWTVLVRGEAYNLANHAQFDEPQRNLTSPSFGKITNTLNDGRVLQLGVRLIL